MTSTTTVIFHIAFATDWNLAKNSPQYLVDSLKHEGFIHCSTRSQVVPVANTFFKGKTGLILLEIDPRKLKSPLKYEDPQPKIPGFNNDEKFPHIYGPINTDAVIKTYNFNPDQNGLFYLPN